MSLSIPPRSRFHRRERATVALRRLIPLAALLAAVLVLAPTRPALAAPPVLTATPNPVVIPLGQTGGAYQFSWSTGSGDNARITVSVDNGAPTVLPSASTSSGTATGLITYGTTQTLRLYASKSPTKLLATVKVTTRRPDQSCAGSCIKGVFVEPHGTFAAFQVIATAQLESFELTAFLDGQPVAGMIGVDVSTWNTFLLHLQPGTDYKYVLKVSDESGNSQVLEGNFTTLKRKVEVTFGELEIIDDADGVGGDGDLTIFFNADQWDNDVEELTLGTGDTFNLAHTMDVVGAPDSMTIGLDIADDDCWGLQLCDQGLGTIRSDDLSGAGHECFDSSEQNSAGVWKSVITIQSGFGEEFAGDVVLKTTGCELKYRAEVHYEVTYI